MGTPSAPLPPVPQSSAGDREIYSAPAAAKFVNSQSVMTMSSLVASPSVHSISEMAENSGGAGRKIAHNRSVSEPDFGKQVYVFIEQKREVAVLLVDVLGGKSFYSLLTLYRIILLGCEIG